MKISELSKEDLLEIMKRMSGRLKLTENIVVKVAQFEPEFFDKHSQFWKKSVVKEAKEYVAAFGVEDE